MQGLMLCKVMDDTSYKVRVMQDLYEMQCKVMVLQGYKMCGMIE